jgi:hypothetical protein
VQRSNAPCYSWCAPNRFHRGLGSGKILHKVNFIDLMPLTADAVIDLDVLLTAQTLPHRDAGDRREDS